MGETTEEVATFRRSKQTAVFHGQQRHQFLGMFFFLGGSFIIPFEGVNDG